MTGTKIDDYLVLRTLGQGAMGVVYLAYASHCETSRGGTEVCMVSLRHLRI
jgi:hypothetical protein